MTVSPISCHTPRTLDPRKRTVVVNSWYFLLVVIVSGLVGGFLGWEARDRVQFRRMFPSMARRVQKAQRTERNLGDHIVKAFKSPDGMFTVKGTPRPWGEGYLITVDHYSKTWAPKLTIIVDCSRNHRDEQISMAVGNDYPRRWYSLNLVDKAISDARGIMETLSL